MQSVVPNSVSSLKLETRCMQFLCFQVLLQCLIYRMEKAMAPHSSTLTWKIPWTEDPGGLQSMGSLESDTTERPHFHFSLACLGEGNGNPLQCSFLENPRDGGACWAAVYGVAESRTRLKRLSSSSSIYMICLNKCLLSKWMHNCQWLIMWAWTSHSSYLGHCFLHV